MPSLVSGSLPPLVQGEAFALQVGPTTPATDFSLTPVTLYLDPPESAGGARVTLTQAAAGVLSAGNTVVTFTKPPSWSAVLAAGTWDLWVAVGDATNRDQWAFFKLPVAAPRNGPLA